MALEQDRGAERLRRLADELGPFLGDIWKGLARQRLEFPGVRRDDRAFPGETLRIRSDRADRVCIHDERQRDAPHDFLHGVEGSLGIAESGTDRDRIDARSQVDDLSHILPKETVADERMHDEHGRIRCDDRSRRGRRRDVDEIRADAQGTISDERGSARVRSARDHEDASVLTLVARRLRHGVEGELAGPDHRGDLRGDPDVRHADSSRVLGRHPFLHIMECDRDSRSDGQVRPETARDVHAEDRFPGGVHLADERRVRLAERAIHPDPEEGVDQQVCGRDRFLALVESRQDLHVPQSLEVRRGLRGGKLVRRAREEDRDAHILREMASCDEAISAVVPGAAEHEDVLSGPAELGTCGVGDRLPGVLHQFQDRDAEVLGVPIEDAHLRRRNHRARIRPTLVKRCPRG